MSWSGVGRVAIEAAEILRPSKDSLALAFSGIATLSLRGSFSMMSEDGVFSIITTYLRLADQGEQITGFRADQYYWRDLGEPQNVAQAPSGTWIWQFFSCRPEPLSPLRGLRLP